MLSGSASAEPHETASHDATLEGVIGSGGKQALAITDGRVPGASAILCSIALVLALCGCASPGFPRAPSLHLAEPVTDLTATRIANRVELHWTAPTRTTDGLDLTIPTAVEICRDDAAPRPNPSYVQPPCTGVLKAAGHAGPSSAVDHLPAGLTNAQASGLLLAYRVRVLNPAGRAAAPSAAAFVAAGPSPAAVEGFRAVQTKAGVVLSWQTSADDAAVEVLRTDLTPRPATLGGGRAATPRAANPLAARHKADSSTEVLLRPDAASPPVPGPRGMIDQSALPDGTYTYRAQRVLPVNAGGKSFAIFSERTEPITVAMRDTFPPEVPQGLASVPGSVAESSGAGSRPTIDLSWRPNAEADLAGYLVYRTDLGGAGGAAANTGPVRLTASPVAGSAFRDMSVLPGHRYAYRVSAVDQKGNESSPSAPIEDSPEGR